MEWRYFSNLTDYHSGGDENDDSGGHDSDDNRREFIDATEQEDNFGAL